MSADEIIAKIKRDGHLTGGDLTGIDLSRRDLTGVILEGVQMPGANLEGAKLSDSALIRVNLTGARMVGADTDTIYKTDPNLWAAESWAAPERRSQRRPPGSPLRASGGSEI